MLHYSTNNIVCAQLPGWRLARPATPRSSGVAGQGAPRAEAFARKVLAPAAAKTRKSPGKAKPLVLARKAAKARARKHHRTKTTKTQNKNQSGKQYQADALKRAPGKAQPPHLKGVGPKSGECLSTKKTQKKQPTNITPTGKHTLKKHRR